MTNYPTSMQRQPQLNQIKCQKWKPYLWNSSITFRRITGGLSRK
uniref:Alternative protein USP28 n=1 Tax=Homo sapiens TaxID=9606 RepID=L8EA89_HUMAN|nr:alternative protein USP28 [Homo sapiens]